MKILIEGTRGKSGLVKTITECLEARGESVVGKITGLEPAIFYRGKKIPIIRKDGKFFIDKENKEVLRRYKKARFKIFENQALSAYTMKAFHLLFKPDIIVIPNIRYEHQDRLGETIEEQAESFAVNFKYAKKVITSEEKENVLDIFERYCKKYNVELIRVRKSEKIPGMRTIYLTDELMKSIFGKGLTKKERDILTREIYSKMIINYDIDDKIHYFKGSKVNDVESTGIVYDYLKDKTDKNFCFVCYFREDRPERTKAFIPFFKRIIVDKRVERIFVAGNNTNKIGKDRKIMKIKVNDRESVFEYCKKNGLVMFTAVNGVNPFMRYIEEKLKGGNEK